MKEQEFIDLVDSQKVIDAKKILTDIVPGNSTIISGSDHRTVIRILNSWFNSFSNLDFIDD